MLTLLFIIGFIFGIVFLLKWINETNNIGIKFNEKFGFIFLLGWIIFGFFAGLDFSEAFGCIIGFVPTFELRKTTFSIISLGLIALAFIIKNQNIRKIICVSELLYWIAKLIIYKGGYAIGYGGTPSTTILFYDTVAIAARLFIASYLFNIHKLKYLKIGIVTFLIIGLKISMFSAPLNMIYRGLQIDKEIEEVRRSLIGDWSGKVSKQKEDVIQFEKIVNIKIDDKYIYLDSISDIEKKYELLLDYHDYGILLKEDQISNFRLKIKKQDIDSLVIIVSDDLINFEFRLKKE